MFFIKDYGRPNILRTALDSKCKELEEQGDKGIKKGPDGGKGISSHTKPVNNSAQAQLEKSLQFNMCMYVFVCIIVQNYFRNEIVIELNFTKVYL